jgi:hypothetical protein
MTLRIFISALTLIISMSQWASATTPPSEVAAGKTDSTYENEIRDHLRRSLFIFSPRYLSMSNNGHHSAFKSNGFAGPSSGLASFHFTFGRRYSESIQFGLAIGIGAQSEEVGTGEAAFRFSTVGLAGGYDFLGASDTDLVLGSNFGYGMAEVQVLSSIQNGRVSEGAFFWEPSISISQKLADRFRLGVVASYLLPFGSSAEVKGQDLGSRSLLPRGATVGLQLIFGRFQAD